jgi:hypothetical protein
MKAVTLRNLPPSLAKVIRKKAQEKGISINKAVITLLEERTGILKQKSQKTLHHDLDDLAGSGLKKRRGSSTKLSQSSAA